MMPRTRRRDWRDAAGTTLIEAIVGSTVLLIGAALAYAGFSMAGNQQQSALQRQRAVALANYTKAMIISSGAVPCASGDILSDNNGAASRLCMADGSGNPDTNCAPDHPASGAEIARVFAEDLNSNNMQVIQANAGAGAPAQATVRYMGMPYRVVWNIRCDVPVAGNKSVDILVSWGDLESAFIQNRVERLVLKKGDGF